MGIDKAGYIHGVTETYLPYVTRINSPRKEEQERAEPIEYRVNPIEKTAEVQRYDSRGNSRRYSSAGGLVNELA